MTGIIFPLYIYPDAIGSQAYQTIINAKKAHPNVSIICTVDPTYQGAGTASDANYVTWIKNLQTAGIIVLGYLATGYGRRLVADIKQEIDNWWNWYKVDGIFFDEMNNLGGGSVLYSNMSAYAKAKGMTITFGNPGTSTLLEYIGTVDNICIYETSGMPAIADLVANTILGKPSQFSYIVFSVSTLNPTLVLNTLPYVGYLSITNDSLSNPYDTIPPYLPDLVALLDTAVIPPPPPPVPVPILKTGTMKGTFIGKIILQ